MATAVALLEQRVHHGHISCPLMLAAVTAHPPGVMLYHSTNAVGAVLADKSQQGS